MQSMFKAPPWAKNAHLQTIWPSKIRKIDMPERVTETIDLPDGDFLDLTWTSKDIQPQQPLFLILHGLEGSAESNYAKGMQKALGNRGWASVLMHFRGCSGRLNRLERGYHSGETGDARFMIEWLREQYPSHFLGAIGYSLGGNVLTKYLGEYGDGSLLDAAAIVSAPLDLAACSRRMQTGFSRNYQNYLLDSMKSNFINKSRFTQFADYSPPSHDEIAAMSSFIEFDDRVTAPLHGFVDAEDYYRRCSGKHFVSQIKTRTLMIHARDDPFMTEEVIPDQWQIPDCVDYELSQHGGHVGFLFGSPWKPRFWLEERIPEWMSHRLTQNTAQYK
ncbi:MAG: hydrolase [Pseudomonadales bacterium]|uniref:Alpha/beta fold family hydrolase n=1 Tax=Oleiphilus messinensis TaxID=141451 RepID=A0A1Y0I9G0_9GAMM|nr:hydrolase [Oleiphilus messinensis]ARU56789.1 alpha/beta fold family hydrolase [Oleiphilus messinensis]MCG8612188.1 hydrolase [Pseudomonadales bacterium]